MSQKPDLILASASGARREMLANAALDFKVIPADIDEKAIQSSDLSPEKVAGTLAGEKALAVSRSHSDALVIGADQVLEFEGQIISKSENAEEARAKLKAMRGKTHRLISAVSIARNNEILWHYQDEVVLTLYDFNDEFLDAYCESAGPVLLECVGGYALEKTGAWLISDIKGDFFTVLGLPLRPLLKYLNKEHGFHPA